MNDEMFTVTFSDKGTDLQVDDSKTNMTIVNFFKAKLHLSVDLNPKVNMSQKHDFETNEENIESIDFRIRLFDSLKRLLHNV